MKDKEKFDVVVVGGGPAGMMAAGRAAERGKKVILLEKNDRLGQKLLLTGNGRCNITQAQFDDRKLVASYGPKGKFLFSALAQFGPKSIIKFLNSRGVKTKIEQDKKVFPVSNKSRDILRVLADYLGENKVEIFFGQTVIGFEEAKKKIVAVQLKGREIIGDNFIIATGGKSLPITGSSGDGYKWAKKLGHKIIEPKPALTSIKIQENWVKEIPGLSLKDICLSIYIEDKMKDSMIGDLIFTHFGISGPVVIKLSRKIGDYLEKGKVILKLDLLPNLDYDELESHLLKVFSNNLNKDIRNFLPLVLPLKLVKKIIAELGMAGDRKINEITKSERKKLVRTIKGIEMTVDSLLGFEQAMVTSGGIDLREIDGRTMKSKIISNLYFAGEVIDLDGPTGGYNLQIAWSTGYLAGSSV